MKLVLGGHGFVGKHLLRKLNANHEEFLAPTEDELDIVSPIPEMNQVDHVYHLAAKRDVRKSWGALPSYFLVNVQGTVNVLEFCRIHQCALTYISAYIYGIPDKLPIRETIKPCPNNPYALSKYLAEEICEFYAKEFNVPVTVLRIFNVYGPEQSEDFLIPSMINQFLDEKIEVVTAQSLKPRRDFIFIDDVIEAIYLTSKTPKPLAVYNVGSGQSYSVEEFLQIVQQLLNSNKKYICTENFRKNEIPDVIADISKIYKDYHWEPITSFKEGLLKTVQSLQK